MRGNITKSEKILLLCAAGFLLVICSVCFCEMAVGSTGSWTVNTGTSADAEEWLPANTGRININTASVELLKELPGIGAALAARIVEYREANGPFETPEALMNVKGIGQATYRSVEELITVEDAAT